MPKKTATMPLNEGVVYEDGHQVAVARLNKDIRAASAALSQDEVRYLVASYYSLQEERIRNDARARALKDHGLPATVVTWVGEQNRVLERQIAASLKKFSESHPVGQWALGVRGIGPVLTAGLLAHIDIVRVTSAGQIWSYAGLNPGVVWKNAKETEARLRELFATPEVTHKHGVFDPGSMTAGFVVTAAEAFGRNPLKFVLRCEGKPMSDLARDLARRPYNEDLKVLCWKIGQSFMKVSGREDAFYGRLYKQRKALEVTRNEQGLNKEAAAKSLRDFNYGADTKARQHYEAGKLPSARLELRAERYAVKLFLAHLFEVWFEHQHGKKPPLPYPIAHQGHVDYIPPPGNEMAA